MSSNSIRNSFCIRAGAAAASPAVFWLGYAMTARVLKTPNSLSGANRRSAVRASSRGLHLVNRVRQLTTVSVRQDRPQTDPGWGGPSRIGHRPKSQLPGGLPVRGRIKVAPETRLLRIGIL